MKIGKCVKGWWIFYFHDYERRSRLDVIPESHWVHSIYMGLNGHNIVERDVKWVCRKCVKELKEESFNQ